MGSALLSVWTSRSSIQVEVRLDTFPRVVVEWFGDTSRVRFFARRSRALQAYEEARANVDSVCRAVQGDLVESGVCV
jgi:hypothetical protein